MAVSGLDTDILKRVRNSGRVTYQHQVSIAMVAISSYIKMGQSNLEQKVLAKMGGG